MGFLDFFKNDFNEVLGVYCDEDKIFLARLADKLDTAEFDFEFDSSSNLPAVLQMAEKIKFICDKNGWKISRVGVVLREGSAVTLQTDFKNVPAAEIQNAVKTWAIAHAKTNAGYTSIKSGNEFWLEALPEVIIEEYISAFDKISMKLCALTEIPRFLYGERPLTPFNRAVFAADIVKNNKSPNILNVKVPTWNVKKISVAAAAIFLIALTGFSAKLAGDYFSAFKRAENAQISLNSTGDTFLLKQDFDASTERLKRFESLISSQEINSQKFNALIKIAKVSDGKIILHKIRTSGETLEIEGVTESPEVVKSYLNRLKISISPKVKLKSSTETDGQFIFSVSINFS